MSSAMFSLHIKLKMQFICIVIAGHLTWHVNFVSTNLFPITLSEKLKYYIINHKSSSWVLFLFFKDRSDTGSWPDSKKIICQYDYLHHLYNQSTLDFWHNTPGIWIGREWSSNGILSILKFCILWTFEKG